MEDQEAKNNEDENDSSSDELKIVLEDEKVVEKSRPKKRKRTETTDSSDDEDGVLPENYLKVEENLCTTAAKNHLTAANVKNILKRVVTNEHVMAIVKLREEEMEEEEEEEAPEPKLTRSKAKELKKITPDMSWPLPLTPVKLIKVTSPEVTKLINQDLPDEESDEEYQPAPGEHDGSDDERDMVGSQSDADSQPRTPVTPGSALEVDHSPTKYTDDGVFKLPKEISQLNEKNEPTIALRTRSKLCLSDTAIEEIEDSFIPPDDVEEYQMDDVWSEFLAEFTNPETPPEPTNEDDEADDPEYNASAEKVKVDSEELREGKDVEVSKKEVKDLFSELNHLFEYEGPFIMAPNSDLLPVSLSPSTNTVAEKESQIQLLDISHSSHILQHNAIQEKTCIDEIAQNISLSAENIEQMSQNKIQYCEITQCAEQSKTTAETQSEIDRKILLTSPLSIKVDVLDGASRVVSSSVELIPSVKIDTTNSKKDDPTSNKDSDVNKKPATNEDEEIGVLTPLQRQILEQQMRQHVQIVTQCFLQLHGHPELWKHGPKQREYLTELKDLGSDKPFSAFIPSNLLPAIDLCNKWQVRLTEDTQEMRDMMQFIVNENMKAIKARTRNSVYYMKFSKQFIETILDSNVFIYPNLLPKYPFRVEVTKKCEYLQSEDQLLAMGIEQFNKYILANPKLYRSGRSDQRIKSLCQLIVCNTLTRHGEMALTYRIRCLKRSKLDNPVKHYYEHGHAPETVHDIIPFDPTRTPRLHPMCSLPETWYPFVKEPSFNKAEVVKRLEVLSDTIEQTNTTVLGNKIPAKKKKGIHNKATYFNSFPSTKDLDAPQTANTLPTVTLFSPIKILPKLSTKVSSEPTVFYDAYRLKKLNSDQFVLSSAVNPTVFQNILTTSVCGQVKQCHLPSIVVENAINSSTKKASENNCVNSVISDESNKEPASLKQNCNPALPKSSKTNRKSPLRTENNKTQKRQPSQKSSTLSKVSCSRPEAPGDGVSQENEKSSEACISSDKNEKCNKTKYQNPVVQLESSYSSLAVIEKKINENNRVDNRRNVCSVGATHQIYSCPCVQSTCGVKIEETLPKNQTLLTRFFKQSGKHNESVTSEPNISKCVEPNRELCINNTDSLTEVNENIGGTGNSNATDDALENSLQHLKHEVVILEHIPNNTLELNESDNSAEGTTSSVKRISGDLLQNTHDDSFESSSEEDISVDTLNIDNSYNSKQDTLNTLLSKLQCLLLVNKERGVLLRNSRQKYKLNSDLAWRIRVKLLRTIQEVEDIMLPSMPNLTTPSKSGIDGSDGSNDLVEIHLKAVKSNDVAAPAIQEDNKKPAEEKSPRSLRNAPRSGISGSQSTKHRLAARAQRELEANKAMFATSDPNTDDLKDSSCATAYFEKVQSRLNGNAELYATNKFTEFQDILETFDPVKETPCDLYYKLKTLFGPENEDLTEEFLTFLTAGQAVEIGRFMDHFMLTNMSDFIERLQIYFYRRPAQLRKILWCLERIIENIDKSNDAVSIDSIKSTILPHLKGNKHLVNWFLRLLPSDKPSESQINSGYEVIDVQGLSKNLESASPTNLDYEVLNIPPIEDNYGNDLCSCMCHNSSDEKYRNRSRHCIPCGMKYMQGRLYIQHGRGLRAARVEWGGGGGGQAHRLSAPPPPPSQTLATTGGRRRAASLDPPQPRDSDDERVSPKRVVRCVRTPTSKTKYVRMSKNSSKLGDIEDTPNKPSCSKSIIRDENLTDSPSRNKNNCDNVENLADALPQSETQEEQRTYSELIIKCDTSAPNADSIEETSSQDDGVEDMITDSPRSQEASCRNSPFRLEPLQTTHVTDSSIIILKTENVEEELNEEVDIDTDTMDEGESAPVIKLEDEQTWTREEDKAILLVLQSESDSDYTFEKIQRLLPHRSIGEIRDRFQSVMQLLQQMASDNV